eukprot:COSAG05_NODE_23607_length_257_cov_0.506329_1_plen_29_part_10
MKRYATSADRQATCAWIAQNWTTQRALSG